MSESTISGADVVRWIQTYASTIAENRNYLTELDSAIGDADHGTNMNRGMSAVIEKLDGATGDDIGGLLKTVGMTLVSKVGGAAGPLYGTLFMQMGAATAGKVGVVGCTTGRRLLTQALKAFRHAARRSPETRR